MELLSPAGNLSGLIGAVNAGADAVYIGGSKFGARAYADNFTDDEIIEALNYAHLHNVKVYLTVNTLIKEREWDECISYIKKFYEAGLDACIVQDLGLISVFGKLFPNMECHVSTQGFATGCSSVEFYKEFDTTRVVLARELSLNEISEIKNSVDIELETFIHGAMCYSFSGECLFSSALGGRSGNRGRCAGPCRLPYKFIEDNKESRELYFLSMKDQCTLELLPKIIDAGIDSLKIEGRMKKPEYTAYVTYIYRKYIDLYKNNPKKFFVDPKDLENIRHIYLRSEIGTGYYEKQNGKEMITLSNPAYSGNDESIMSFAKENFLYGYSKLPVNAFLSVLHNCPVSLTLTYNDISVTEFGMVPEHSVNSPITLDSAKKQISKMGDSYFNVNEFDCEMDNDCFVPIKELNELRRKAVNSLLVEFAKRYQNTKSITDSTNGNFCRKHVEYDKKPLVFVTDIEQFNAVKAFKGKCHFVLSYELARNINCDISDCFVKLPEILRNKDKKYIESVIEYSLIREFLGLYTDSFESIEYLKDYPKVLLTGSGIYTFNKRSAETVSNFADSFILPYELNSHEISDLNISGCYLNVYGKIPLMRTANCVLKSNRECRKNKGDSFVYIKDRMNAVFPVFRNCNNCFNIIYNSVPIFIENNDKYYSCISFTDEDPITVNAVMEHYINNKDYEPSKYTKAYWKHGVE